MKRLCLSMAVVVCCASVEALELPPAPPPAPPTAPPPMTTPPRIPHLPTWDKPAESPSAPPPAPPPLLPALPPTRALAAPTAVDSSQASVKDERVQSAADAARGAISSGGGEQVISDNRDAVEAERRVVYAEGISTYRIDLAKWKVRVKYPNLIHWTEHHVPPSPARDRFIKGIRGLQRYYESMIPKPEAAPTPISLKVRLTPADTQTAVTGAKAAPANAYTPLQWIQTFELARAVCEVNHEPLVAFFCDEKTALTCGESEEDRAAYKKEHGGVEAPRTPFEDEKLRNAFSKAGMARFTKVPLTSKNAATFLRLNASVNTVLFLSPDGSVLKTFKNSEVSTDTLTAFLENELPLLKAKSTK